MTRELNPQLLSEFLDLAGERLKGEWLLVGGTLLPAVGISVRSTVDIDLLGLGAREQAQNLELMEIADALGLGIEAVNQAAAFFLKKVGYKQNELIVLRQSTNSTIYRPSVALYWRLKLGRLTETDLTDCIHYLKFCESVGDPLDYKRLSAQVAAAIGFEKIPEKVDRMRQLQNSLSQN